MRRVLLIAGLCVALASARASSQGIPLATLAGRVTSEDGVGLPGATVTVESPSLPDRRSVTALGTGAYRLLVPPGTYTVRFAMQGMRTVERTIALAAAGAGRLDVAMFPLDVEEFVAVTADSGAGSPLDTTQVMTNIPAELTDRLPIDRSLRSAALLAPGVTDHGPEGSIGSANTRPALVISGAQSFESLFLVDGVVVNENLRGQPQDLFIEDAIQETTVLTGAVSAEYGRFTGGVVNTLTRSGGNVVHGSVRATLTNDAWTETDPLDERFGADYRVDEVNGTYEATLGGPIWKDRVWFFGAGRSQELSDSRTTQLVPQPWDTDPSPVPYVHETEEWRLEAKLTGRLGDSQNLVANYTRVDPEERNGNYFPAGDLTVLDDVRSPHALLALHYDGVLTSRLILEAQYSFREFTTEGGGSDRRDFVGGTRIDVDLRDFFTLNAPAGSERSGEEHENESWLARASYLVSTRTLGTHDFKVGLESFVKRLRANYYFSGSDFVVWNTNGIVRGAEVFPVFETGTTVLEYRPILQPSQGDEFRTDSAFVNDRWEWGRWSFNLGLRYDKNDSENGGGVIVSRSDAWSPRLAARWDPTGRGRLSIDAGYARYAAGLHEGIVQLFGGAGQTSFFRWRYRGDCINCDLNAPADRLVSTREALAAMNAWFQSIGGIDSPPFRLRIAGFNRAVPPESLVSPSAEEYAFGVGVALGGKGWARADFLYRDFDDFYDNRIDLSTGQSPPIPGTSPPQTLDMEILENSAVLDRRYEALQTRVDYRFSPQLQAGAGYTWSRLTGNVVGENPFVSAAPSFVGAYPEYKRESWAYPTGYLPGDQRHRLRLWVNGQLPVSFGELAISLLESYGSGLAYEAVGFVDPSSYVENPGYSTPPFDEEYFFSGRGEYRTDSVSSTDVALTLTVRASKSLEIFLQPQVLNVFNEQASTREDATVLQGGYQPFDPFTETPVRGVHYDLSPSFGTAVAYQPPRTFRVSAGMRF